MEKLELSLDERESFIRQIILGKFLLEIENYGLFIYQEPGLDLLMESDLIYKSASIRFMEEGVFLTKEQAEQLLEEEGIWSEDKTKLLETLQKNQQTLKEQKFNLRFRSKEKARIEKMIEITNDEVARLRSIKDTFYSQTIEYQARMEQKSWVIVKSLFTTDGKLYWPSWEMFEEDYDASFMTKLIVRIFLEGIFSESQLRYIARNEPWRSKWKTACKINLPLFKDEYLNNMAYLLGYWSNIYDSVYDSMDCPSSDVINDDEALDMWFTEQYTKRKASEKERAAKGTNIISNPKIANAQDVFIAVDSKEDAQAVYNELNSPESRKIFAAREKVIHARGEVREKDLPDVSRNIRMQLSQAVADKHKNR